MIGFEVERYLQEIKVASVVSCQYKGLEDEEVSFRVIIGLFTLDRFKCLILY